MAVCDIQTGRCFKDGEWIPVEEMGGLQTGDLLEMPSKFHKKYPLIGGNNIPLVNHYGVYLEVNGEPMVAHNPFGGYPEIIPLSQLEKDRKIKRVIRMGLTSEHIIKRVNECKHLPYNFFGFNCEKFIFHLCSCDVGYDQRWGWVLFFIIIILLIFAFRK